MPLWSYQQVHTLINYSQDHLVESRQPVVVRDKELVGPRQLKISLLEILEHQRLPLERQTLMSNANNLSRPSQIRRQPTKLHA